MTAKNIDKLEARIWASYFQDGMWDIFLGMLMLTNAFRTFIDHWAVTASIFPILFLIILLKKYVTSKRLGYARFSRKRRKKRIFMFIVILSANIITLAVLTADLLGMDASTPVRTAVIVGLVFISFSAVAYFLDFLRFFIWGALFTIAVAAAEFMGAEVGSYLFLIFGSLAVMVGISFFISFLRKYPTNAGVAQNG